VHPGLRCHLNPNATSRSGSGQWNSIGGRIGGSGGQGLGQGRACAVLDGPLSPTAFCVVTTQRRQRTPGQERADAQQRQRLQASEGRWTRNLRP